MDDFAEQIVEITEMREDAAEHVSHLPELTTPEAFDNDVEVSLYNDQNDTEIRNG